MNSDAVALAFVLQVGFHHGNAFLEGLVGHISDDRAELFPAQHIPCAQSLGLGEQNAGALGCAQTDLIGNLVCEHANDHTAECAAAGEQAFPQLVHVFFAFHQIAALLLHLSDKLCFLIFGYEHGLFAQADQAVVECAADDDLANSVSDVSIFVDDALDVALANTDGGLAGGVSCLDHAHAAGSNHHVSGAHQFGGQVVGDFFQAQHQIFRQTQLLQLCAEHLHQQLGALDCAGMGSKDDRVAALQCKCAVAHGGDDGVGGGDDGSDHANRLCHFDHAAFFNPVDDVAGLLVLQALPDQCRLIAAFCNLVLFAAHTGFFCGHGAQLFSVVIYDLADGSCSCICLFLRCKGERCLCGLGSCDQFFYCHVRSSPILDSGCISGHYLGNIAQN